MSPSALPPSTTPRASRVALIAYLVCGVVGAYGMFAAANDLARDDDGDADGDGDVTTVEQVAAPVPAPVDARALVGVWRSGDAWLVLEANGGLSSSCGAGVATLDTWDVRGDTIVTASGVVVGRIDDGGAQLQIGDTVFHPVEGPPSVTVPRPASGPVSGGEL